MQRIRSLFGKASTQPPKPKQGFGLKQFKKLFFYGFFGYIGLLMFSKFYKTNVTYYMEGTKDNIKLVQDVQILKKGTYCPSLLAYFGWMQRIYTKYLQSSPYTRFQQSQFEGYQQYWIPLHHNLEKVEKPSISIVVAGSQGLDNNLKHLMLSMYRNGFKTVGIVLDDYHDIQKFNSMVKKIKEQQKTQNLFAVGVEYGANLIVKYAAEHPQAFKGIVSLGNPLDLQRSQKNIQSSFLWKYILYKDILKGRLKNHPEIPQKIPLSEIDKYLYKIADDNLSSWKQQNSSINYIQKLKTRALFLQSQQDPFSIPLNEQERIQMNPNCIYIESQRGGHNQWLQSKHFIRWSCRVASQFFKMLNKQLQK